MTPTTTTTTTPATTTTTAAPTAFDRTLFLAAIAAVAGKVFDPGASTTAEGLSIPASWTTAEERRAYALYSAQLYAGDSKMDVALSWRIRHAYEAGVISKPTKVRFGARQLAGDSIERAEAETRAAMRQAATNRIHERQAVAMERVADSLELVFQAMALSSGTDMTDVRTRFNKLAAERAQARANEAKATAEAQAAKAKAEADAKATKAA